MDEIDGMNNGDKGGINTLIKLIRPKKTKKQKLEEVTMNPIICIGNYHIDKKIKELSRGMKVKLMLASALSHHAKLLLLDEPTSGLDPVAREEICDILREFVSDDNHSVFFSTHITSDLEKIADYIVLILDGRIVYSGEKFELIETYSLIKGGLDDLNDSIKSQSIGLRKHSTGFETLYPNDYLNQLSTNILIESSTLEEIIIYMNKELKR